MKWLRVLSLFSGVFLAWVPPSLAFNRISHSNFQKIIEQSEKIEVPVAIILVPDLFSEETPQKISLQPNQGHNESEQLIADWRQISTQRSSSASFQVGVRNVKMAELFEIQAMGSVIIVQLKSPVVETILDRKSLADRYSERLAELKGLWPVGLRNIILVGQGRGFDVARAMNSGSESKKANVPNDWRKELKAVVGFGQNRNVELVLGKLAGASGDLIIGRALVTSALVNFQKNIAVLGRALDHMNANTVRTHYKLNEQYAQVYAHFLMTVYGFWEEIIKLKKGELENELSGMEKLLSDVINDSENEKLVLDVIDAVLRNPTQDTLMSLITTLIAPEDLSKVGGLLDSISDPEIYEGLPVASRLYYRYAAQALQSTLGHLRISLPKQIEKRDSQGAINILRTEIKVLSSELLKLTSGMSDMAKYQDELVNPFGPELGLESGVYKIESEPKQFEVLSGSFFRGIVGVVSDHLSEGGGVR
jgi:hypothetical protein